MGKRNRNRGNRGNNTTTKTNTSNAKTLAKDVMVRIMKLVDSGAILDAITDKNVIISASDKLINHDYESEAFDKIVDMFHITLNESEINAVINVLEPVLYNMGDLPGSESDIAVSVYQNFVKYLGENGQDKNCIKTYDTLVAVQEIVQSDLDDIGKSVSDDTLTTLAVVETLYTVTDVLAAQVWDDMRLTASSSNIPDKDVVEVVVDTKKPEESSKEEEPEKIPEDQVEVLGIDDVANTQTSQDTPTGNTGGVSDGKDENHKTDSTSNDKSEKTKSSNGPFGMSNDMIKALVMSAMSSGGDIGQVSDKLVNLIKPILDQASPNMSQKSTETLKGFIKSIIEDNIPVDSSRQIEENVSDCETIHSPNINKNGACTTTTKQHEGCHQTGIEYDDSVEFSIMISFDNGRRYLFNGTSGGIAKHVIDFEKKHGCRVIPTKITTMWGDPISLDYRKSISFSNGCTKTFVGSDYVIDKLVKAYEQKHGCHAVKTA